MNPGRLHVLTDETLGAGRSHLDLALAAADGGADVVQYREKRARPVAALIAAAGEIVRALDGRGPRVVVNDRIEVALAAGAGGVHLGRLDADPRAARSRLGPRALVGRTANGLAEARALVGAPVDYLGVGPVFGTASKRDPAPALGLPELARICRAVAPLPVIAIGNVRPERVAELLGAGAFGVAVLSAVAAGRDPAAAVARLREEIDRCLGKRDGTRIRSAG